MSDYYHPQSSWAADVKLIAEAERVATLEAAVRKVIDLVNVYLPPDTKMGKDEFISEVIGAVDNPDVFRALEKGSAK